MAATDVIAGLEAALSVGAVTADVVAVEARRHASLGGSEAERHSAAHPHELEQPGGQSARNPIISLTQRRLADPASVIAGLPPDTRPLPSVAGYDELLTRRAIPPATTTEETAS